jgi:oxygen-independent coproporphyrinogen-3 oxidase
MPPAASSLNWSAMDARLLAKYDRPVPRYTSYPTAPHFTAAVGADKYAGWLGALAPGTPTSLYVHIPFCDSLCWFCGCHMRVVNRYSSVGAYLDLLRREIDLAASATAGWPTIQHLHFGGGSPDILKPDDVRSIVDHLRGRFAFADDLEFAVEIDPRAAGRPIIEAWAAAGATRASVGVQDFDPRVQEAVNRRQSFDCTAQAIDGLRAAGIGRINIDLIYGLPHQSVAGVQRTADRVIALVPDRIALFGYAHVPAMKPHQRLIDEQVLPDGPQRWAQFEAAAELLRQAGYLWIGLDHFARPDDPLAIASASGRLRRNFQGYTTDRCEALLGLGASAIGALPQGYVQNKVGFKDYAGDLRIGRLPIARGIALSADDRRRRAIIERLMCDRLVDLAALDGEDLPDLDCLADMAADGLVEIDGSRIAITERGRPFMRVVCAAFDRYLQGQSGRYSRAV